MHKPIPAPVPLTLDLLAWAALVPAITFAAGFGLFIFWTPLVEQEGGPTLWDVLHSIGRKELAGLVFSCFVW